MSFHLFSCLLWHTSEIISLATLSLYGGNILLIDSYNVIDHASKNINWEVLPYSFKVFVCVEFTHMFNDALFELK